MKRLLSLAAFVLLSAYLTACSVGETMEPSEFQRMSDNIPDGPGILTGEDGEFVLYRR